MEIKQSKVGYVLSLTCANINTGVLGFSAHQQFHRDTPSKKRYTDDSMLEAPGPEITFQGLLHEHIRS